MTKNEIHKIASKHNCETRYDGKKRVLRIIGFGAQNAFMEIVRDGVDFPFELVPEERQVEDLQDYLPY